MTAERAAALVAHTRKVEETRGLAAALGERALVLSDTGDAGQQRVLIGGAVILGRVVTRLIEAAGNRRSTGQARPAGPSSQPGYPGQPGQSRPAGQPPGSGPVPRGGNQA